MNKGQYLYGFVFSEAGQDFICKGLDDQDVSLKNRGSLSLAISDFKTTDFSALPQKELLCYLQQHHHAIETIMERFCIIPFKFGTMIENPDQIKKIFTNSYDSIRKKFTLLQDMMELDVMASFNDLNQVFNEITQLDAIEQFKQKAASEPTSDLHKAQIELGQMVNTALDEKRSDYRKVIVDRLSTLSTDIRTNDITQESMVSSLAFMIHKKDQPIFEKTIEDLDQLFEGKIDFKIIGPLPFYSFYTLTLHKGDHKELDYARRILNLPEKADLSCINDAYKELCKTCHPDNDCLNKDLTHRFEELNKAYQIVMEYMNDNGCSFLKEDVEQWIQVKSIERENAVMS